MKSLKRSMNDSMMNAVDELLSLLGLTRRRSITGPALGSFAAGTVVGVAITMLLAPTAGEELITKLSGRVRALRNAAARSLSAAEGDEIDAAERARRTAYKTEKHAAQARGRIGGNVA